MVRRRRAERVWITVHPGPGHLGPPAGPPSDIPSVLATGDATQRIADEAVVTVDGAAGTIVLDPGQ